MLVLSRRVGEEIIINDNIRVTVVAVKGDRVRLGIVIAREEAAALHEELGGGDAAARRTSDGDALAPNGERRPGGHRSFNVVRLKSAKMIARMTNRVMTFGSLQPISSKWW